MDPYGPLALMLLVSALFGAVLLVAGGIFRRLLGITPRPDPAKNSPYECGVLPVGDARTRFPVRYYLVALVFVVFDLEAVFVYPWAVSFRDAVRETGLWQGTHQAGMLAFGEMLLFMGVLAVGLIYLWRRGALDWE